MVQRDSFLVHIQQALDRIRQEGLQAAIEKAVKDKEECVQRLQWAQKAFANYKGKDESPPNKKAVQNATTAIDRKQETYKSLITQVFGLYSNLLTEEARRPWNKILEEQVKVAPWTDPFRIEHSKSQGKTWQSIMDCVTFIDSQFSGVMGWRPSKVPITKD